MLDIEKLNCGWQTLHLHIPSHSNGSLYGVFPLGLSKGSGGECNYDFLIFGGNGTLGPMNSTMILSACLQEFKASNL